MSLLQFEQGVMINRGSEWHRWEPHIHGPDTIMNNQYGGPDTWEDYLSALEAASPTIKAIAATDYYVTETYEHVLAVKLRGRLLDVELVRNPGMPAVRMGKGAIC